MASAVRIKCNLSVVALKCNGPTVAKLQKISVQAGHQGANSRVMTKKTERQFQFYLDHTTSGTQTPL